MSEAAVTGSDAPIAIDLLTDPAGVPRARAMLQRAQWAASAFARYDRAAVDRIAAAAAAAGAARAREYADWAVRETGFGVAEHKVIKNLASSTGLIEAYAGHDYVTPRVDPVTRIVEIPRPAGVVLALTPSTNPVATVFVKSLLALMTRNAVVVSPHPLARECSADAARALAEAAVAAGAPDGVIQVVDEPSVPLINALMADERGPRRVQLGHAGHRGGARQRAGFRCGRCGPAGSCAPDRGQQELRQFYPVHQRVSADRHRGGRRGIAAAPAARGRVPAPAGGPGQGP